MPALIFFLALLFVILKCVGVLTCSWWWLTAIIGGGIALCIAIPLIVIFGVLNFVKSQAKREGLEPFSIRGVIVDAIKTIRGK